MSAMEQTPTAPVQGEASANGFRRACGSGEVQEGSFKLANYHGTPVALFRSNGKIHAIDNRCPHMGFPLCKGEVHDGIVVCPWHHWKFDLATGGCFSAGEYDVTAYQVEETDGEIRLGPPLSAGGEKAITRAEYALRESLKSRDPFRIAKAVTKFMQVGGSVRRLVRFGAQMALSLEGGGPGGVWGGLTSLANAAHLSNYLESDERTLGLIQAFTELSRVVAGAPLRRPVRPLEPLEKNDPQRLRKLLLYFSDKRTAVGVERCLATLVAMKTPMENVAHWAYEALAQHLYPSAGHPHDFLYRAFDLLEQIGGDWAPSVLGTLAGSIAGASRAEESEPWSPYVERLFGVRKRLASGELAPGQGGIESNALGHRLAEGRRHEVLDALDEALAAGASAHELSRALNIGWALRLARFSLVNETDWAQVFHGVIAADSMDQAIRRFGPHPALTASLYDSAVQLYLTQSLNIPKVRLPLREAPGTLPVDDPEALRKTLADGLELRQPDRAGAAIAHYLWRGYDERALLRGMIAAMFRENGDFHSLQTMRACVNQFEALRGDPDRHLPLVGLAHMFAAQRMEREVLMSTRFALKLSRGEYLAGGEEA